MEWSAGSYRVAYHFNRFTSGWRSLLIFYLAMCLAGYAQVIHSYIFYAAWGALVLMYWEPYLSPPFPWVSDSPIAAFGKLASRKYRTGGTDVEETKSIQQWVLAIERGLNETQLRVYKVLQAAIIVPYIFLLIGVIKQATMDDYKDQTQAVYSAFLLLALMTVYTVSTYVCLFIFHCVQAQESIGSRMHEVDWQPHDMLFFTCKILGETLNTVVSTLVAGSFVTFMPWQIFWLCILITALSYTATNLLYDFEGSPPVHADDEDSPSTDLPLTNQTSDTYNQGKDPAPIPESDTPGFYMDVDKTPTDKCWRKDDSAQLPRPSNVGKDTADTFPNSHDSSSAAAGSIKTTPKATAFSSGTPTLPTTAAPDSEATVSSSTAAAADQTAQPTKRAWLINKQQQQQQWQRQKAPPKTPSPPFLKYRRPKGFLGKSIIGLLLAVAVPSVVLLWMVIKGIVQDKPHLYLLDPQKDCKVDTCLHRYNQLLLLQGCLGCIISYYAFTVGFLGAGPVTWLYRQLHKKHGV